MGCCFRKPVVHICDLINTHRVILFSKSRCADCFEVKRMLNEMGFDYATVELDLCDGYQCYSRDLIRLSGYKTVPILFIDRKLIGGKLDVAKLKFSGRLKKMIGDKAPKRHSIGPMFNYANKSNRYF